MKLIALLPLTASRLGGCEKPTGPTAYGPSADLTASSRTTFSGDARVIQATVLGLPTIVVGEAGPLDESGGAKEFSLLTITPDQTGGILGANVVHATTVGQGNHSRAEASVADARLNVRGAPSPADVLASRAEATCDGSGGASASGSSELAGLAVNGTAIAVTGQPNQTETIGPVTVVINEQAGSKNGNRADLTVNALHVTVADPLGGAPLADVVISSSHADIACAGCSNPIGDFVTGGGWITGPSGARANFGVAGGMKNGALWGHLSYIDHGSDGLKVKGTGVTAYSGTGTSRHIEGTAEINGASGCTYKVDVADNGEPGRNDTFSLELSNGYKASGNLAGGNIQLHGESPCP